MPAKIKTARKLTTVEAATRLGVVEVTLRKWRKRGYGPRWYRIGAGRGRIYYLAGELDEWLHALAKSSGHSGDPVSATRERQ